MRKTGERNKTKLNLNTVRKLHVLEFLDTVSDPFLPLDFPKNDLTDFPTKCRLCFN